MNHTHIHTRRKTAQQTFSRSAEGSIYNVLKNLDWKGLIDIVIQFETKQNHFSPTQVIPE